MNVYAKILTGTVLLNAAVCVAAASSFLSLNIAETEVTSSSSVVPASASAGSVEQELAAGMTSMMKYDFGNARTHLNRYKELAGKRGEEVSAKAIKALAAIPLAEDMLAGQVEQLVVIDSISVAAVDYIDEYELSTPSGRVFVPENLNDMGDVWAELTPFGPIFESEDGTVRYVGVLSEIVDEDSDEPSEISRLYESFKLDDGTWTEPLALFEEDVDAAFPFMMSDGCTFYFASRTETGLGGWDIYRSYRDSDDGSFRKPVNMGMPYNSPGDDYMLAVDEYTGAGRWTTNRNEQFSDSGDAMSVVYVYVPSEVRKNYDADTPEIKQFAALWTLHNPSSVQSDDEGEETEEEEQSVEGDEVQVNSANVASPGYKMTWPEGANYSGLLAKLAEGFDADDDTKKGRDFTFEGPSGKIYTSYSQLPQSARMPMQRYQEALLRLHSAEKELHELQTGFKEFSTDSNRKSIELQQSRVDELRSKTRQARNNLFEALR